MKKFFEEPSVICVQIVSEAVANGLPDMEGGVGSTVFPED